jgi:hypothetical protein
MADEKFSCRAAVAERNSCGSFVVTLAKLIACASQAQVAVQSIDIDYATGRSLLIIPCVVLISCNNQG